MKSKELQCSYCKNKFPREHLAPITTRKKSCKNCLEVAREKEKAKTDIDYTELIDYICKGYGLKAPTGKQLGYIKRFKSLGYSHLDIQKTIYYIETIVGKSMKGDLGLVPYYYEQAMHHFEVVNKNNGFIDNTEVKEVVIERRKINKSRIEKTRFINIDNLV